MTCRKPREVLMIGTSPDTMGGIASVVRVYRSAGLFSRWPVSYLPTHADGGPLVKLSVAARAFVSVMAALLRGEDVVLHVHGASRASFWRKCLFICPALWARKSVIFHLHGGEFIRFYQRECSALKKRLVRYVLDSSARIIVLSETWRASLAEITTNERIDVVMNPVERPDPGTPVAREKALVLFLGRINEGKGIRVLLEALVAVKERHPGIRLVCAGDGELDRVRAAAAELGLSPDVELPGWVNERRRAELLSRATLFALPSFAEGLPMSVLEAMAAGVPVIATPVGGIPDIVTHGAEGLLVAPGDAAALAEAIVSLLDNAGLRLEMGRRGQARHLEAFSTDTVLARLEAVYRELGVAPRARVGNPLAAPDRSTHARE